MQNLNRARQKQTLVREQVPVNPRRHGVESDDERAPMTLGHQAVWLERGFQHFGRALQLDARGLAERFGR
jgi:hypothetical protein